MKTTILKPISKERGFCFDKSFVKKVKKRIGSNKYKVDELLCATVVAEFLTIYEGKNHDKNGNTVH